MIKPYTVPLNSLVELTETFGDLVVLLCAIPWHILASLYHRVIPWGRSKPTSKEADPKPAAPVDKPTEVAKEQLKSAESTEHGTARSRRRPLQDAQTRSRTSHTVKEAAAVANKPHKPVVDKAAHEIWYPPPPAYDESPPNESTDLADVTVDDWHQYEPFPAAYPATPLPTRKPLFVPEIPAPPPLEGISEDQSYYYSYIAEESVQVEEQGFQESLRSPRETPRSAGVLSDDDLRSPGTLGTDIEDEEMDYEDDVEEEEDDFDVTLRTPAIKRVQNMSNGTTSSMDRDSNTSTEFNTVYGGSPLRTRTNSEASATTSGSETTSLAGTKRPISSIQESRPLRQPLKERLPSSQTIRGARGTVRAPLSLGTARSSSSTHSRENRDKAAAAVAAAAADDTSSLAPKRRRVALARDGQASRKPTLRVATSAEAASAKDAMVRKTAAVTAVPRATQARTLMPGLKSAARSRSGGGA